MSDPYSPTPREKMAALAYQERHLEIVFPGRECPECGEHVRHRVERDHKQGVERTECSNCHHTTEGDVSEDATREWYSVEGDDSE